MINYRSFEIAVNSVMTTLRHLKARKKALAEGSNKPYVTAGARGVRGQKNSKNFNLHNRGKAGSQKPIRKIPPLKTKRTNINSNDRELLSLSLKVLRDRGRPRPKNGGCEGLKRLFERVGAENTCFSDRASIS